MIIGFKDSPLKLGAVCQHIPPCMVYVAYKCSFSLLTGELDAAVKLR